MSNVAETTPESAQMDLLLTTVVLEQNPVIWCVDNKP
jgi:hypothetical protein